MPRFMPGSLAATACRRTTTPPCCGNSSFSTAGPGRQRDHAVPDDVQALAVPVLAHRLVLAPEAGGVTAEDVIADAVSAVAAR